jgi:hypothetical protein
MPNIIKMPISNVLMGSDYTGAIAVGGQKTVANVILDTGSSTLAVDGNFYNPITDQAAKTTKIAQAVKYGSGNWVGAVVDTSVSLSDAVTLQNVNLAVTYSEARNMFGKAQGIFGLAYAPLNSASLMPADTWKSKYDADVVERGKQVDLDPYFSQLEEAGVVANKFAFYTKRSIISVATGNPVTDPANQGVFVIGGGEEATELYTGGFTSVAVLDDAWYNTNLISVQIGNQPPIKVESVLPGGSAPTNSIVDSGTNSLLFDQTLFDQMVAAFRAISPDFATLLQRYSLTAGAVGVQSQIDLSTWPDLVLTLQGADGTPVTLTISPANYWQFDATKKGAAIANMFGDGGSMGGQSILGLPLFNEYYTVFDRTAASGHGVINFAKRV